MPGIRVTDVPVETVAVLRRRANAAHQSLPEYVRTRLIEEAATPTLEEVLAPAGRPGSGSVPFDAAVAVIPEGRDRD